MFQHVKQYRKQYKLTQEALGELLGMNPKFIWNLEKHKPRMTLNGKQVVYSPQEETLLNILFGDTPKAPDFYQGLPTLTGKDLYSIRKQKKLTQDQAGEIIGISGTQWGAIESGKSKEDSPNVRRWYTLLLMANLQEYFQHNDNLTPAHETPMVEVVPGIASESDYVKIADWIAEKPQVKDPEIIDKSLIPFAYGSQKVRVKWIDGEPWFMLSDVCKAIGYQSIEHASKLVRESAMQKVQVTDNLSRVQSANFISESGLYQFLTRARVPSVEPFQDWVFDEVLPSIRKTGQYQAPQIQPVSDPLSQVAMIGQALQTIAQQMQIQQEKIAFLEQATQSISYLEVSKTDRSEVLEIVQTEVLEAKRQEKQEQKLHYRKRKELEKRISDLGWSVVKQHGGNHGEIIKSLNKRIKAALRGVYGYAIARERYTDDDFVLAYQVVSMAEKELNDFPKQGEINFDGDAA